MKLKAYEGYFLVVLAGGLWGTLGLLGKILAKYQFSSYDIAFYRIFIGFLLLFIYLSIKDRNLLKIDKMGIVYTGLLGIIFQGLFNYFYFSAIDKTSITTAVILLYTAPIFSNILSRYVFKENFTMAKFTAVILCIVGCFFTATGGNLETINLNMLGVLMGAGAGLIFGTMPIVNKIILEKYDRLTVLLYSFGFGALFLLPFSNPSIVFSHGLDLKLGIVVFILGSFPTIVAYAVYMRGLYLGIEPSRASIISTIEVVVSVLIAYFIFKESMTSLKVMGIMMVIFSVVIIQRGSSPKIKLKKARSVV